VLGHPTHSPDLPLCDLRMFGILKKELKCRPYIRVGRRFQGSRGSDVQAAAPGVICSGGPLAVAAMGYLPHHSWGYLYRLCSLAKSLKFLNGFHLNKLYFNRLYIIIVVITNIIIVIAIVIIITSLFVYVSVLICIFSSACL
jgi:hypothetical protein